MKRVTKIYTDQIDKLTEKLMDYKRRLRNFEREKEQAKPQEVLINSKVEDLQ